MTSINQILEKKGKRVISIGPEASAFVAVEKMIENSVGSLLVMQGEQVVGIVTERDFLRRVPLQGKRPRETSVAEIMTKNIVCVDPEYSVEECMAIMTERRFRHLPVIDQGKLAGIISIGDLVKQVSQEKETHIKYLTDYISGKYPG